VRDLRRLSLVLVAVVMMVSCDGDTDPNSAPEGPADSATTPSGSAAPTSPGELEAEWYEDSDNNGAPDFIESDLGYSPTEDDCLAASGCSSPALQQGLELVERRNNTLLMLDSSGSMAGSAGGVTKMIAAKRSIARYVTGLPTAIKLGFLVFGHKGSNTKAGKPESCRGIDVLEPIGRLSFRNVDNILGRFEPTGWTPIAASLNEARREFQGRQGDRNRIILVTDGIETCGGDPVAAARRLHGAGIEVVIDVVGFDIPSETDARALRRIAEVTGGRYRDARTAADLQRYFDQLRGELGKIVRAIGCVSQTRTEQVACGAEFREEVVQEIAQHRDEAYAEGDQARGDAIQEILDVAFEKTQRGLERLVARYGKRLMALLRQYNAAGRRYRQKYGEAAYEPQRDPCPIPLERRVRRLRINLPGREVSAPQA
jgi:hypothetical protein